MTVTHDDAVAKLQHINAMLQRELAQQGTERDVALAREAALADVLDIINSSAGDMTPVFEAILEKAHTLCGAAAGLFGTYDGQQFRYVATHGIAAEYVAAMRQPFHAKSIHLALLHGEHHVQIPDVTAYAWGPDEEHERTHFAMSDLRTCILVPLRKDGALLGYIGGFRKEIRRFSKREIALLESFAAQAVIAMENARLLGELRQRTGELRESHEFQTATSDVLKVISRSTFDLQPVLEMLLVTAARLCEADNGLITNREGDAYRVAATFSGAPEYTAFMQGRLMTATRGTVLGRTALEGQVVHLADIASDPEYTLSQTVTLGQARTLLGVPLLRERFVVGVIVLGRIRVQPFTDQQIELLRAFADQAVIAIENTRLLTEQREALEQQTATAEVLRVINSSPGNLAPVFETMLDRAMQLCEAAFGELFTFDGERFKPSALLGLSPANVEFRQRTANTDVPESVGRRIRQGAGVLQISDLMAEETYHIGDPDRRALVDLGGARTALVVALRKDDALLGLIIIYRQEVRPFSDRQIAVLQSFAAQAVIAMENARLLGELRTRTDELAQRQAELRVIFENTGDGVAMFDETPRLVAWNRKLQDILDVPDGLLVERRTFAEYIRYLADRGEFGEAADREAHLRRFTENAGRHYSYERTRPDGRVIEVRHNPIPSGGFVLIYSDITERKRNEAEIGAARDAALEASRTIEAAYRELKAAQANLIQAEKMASLGQLTAGIAHEIKNPLNFVNNFAILSVELLGELKETAASALGALDDDKRSDIDEVVGMLTSNLEKITEHGRRADGIVRSMLEHSRGASGERRTVDLNALVDEALNLAYHGARAQDQSFNIALERDFESGTEPIQLNPQDMTRVCLNLFVNGFYAARMRQSAEGVSFEPSLKVATRDLGGAMEIRVRDNGTGIPADIMDKLFQPFFTTKPTGEGTGLGLSITYDIVTKQHGGTISVESEVGTYTEFTVTIPRVATVARA
jgi:two-component system, NtrC family, sensor kinase